MAPAAPALASAGSDSTPPAALPAPSTPIPTVKPDPVVTPQAVAPAPTGAPAPKPAPAVAPAVTAAKARAIELYGKEPGFVGVTDRIVKTRDGKRFLYINIKGDGNCGFYAMGVDRARFVNTIESLVKDQHDGYQAFVKKRSDLVRDIAVLMFDDDRVDVVARTRAIDDRGDVAPALNLLTDFESEKKKYYTELFQDERNRLIKNLQELEGVSKVKSNPELSIQVTNFINVITSAGGEDVKGIEVTETYKALSAKLALIGVSTNKIQSAFKDLVIICGYGDGELFEKGKRRLMNKIENLTTPSSYEAFLTAFRLELVAGGIKADDLTTKEKVLAGVKSVFSKNRGSATWFPGGLFAAVKDSLGVEYNIWAMDSGDVIKLCSSSGDSRGVAAEGSRVRNVFFMVGHYDMLIPIDE